MKDQERLITDWRIERDQICAQLREKAKTQLLSEVEKMILNPFTLEQAQKQVIALNKFVSGCTDSQIDGG